jgi:hypothetical protein
MRSIAGRASVSAMADAAHTGSSASAVSVIDRIGPSTASASSALVSSATVTGHHHHDPETPTTFVYRFGWGGPPETRHKRGCARCASAAELPEDLVEADAGPHGDRLGRTPLARAARRDHRAGADETFEVGSVGVEWPQLGHWTCANGDHGALAGLGGAHRVGEAGTELSDPNRSVRI